MTSLLVLGGARSGKSRYAERLARTLAETPVYVATSRAWDDDHRARIERHRRDRGSDWQTIEEERAFGGLRLDGRVVVVDCLTLWLTNLFVDARQNVDLALTEARREIDVALAASAHWLFVSNEIGLGLHAETTVGRKFTDLQGFINQYVASHVDAVAWMVAGIPHYVKGREPTKGDLG